MIQLTITPDDALVDVPRRIVVSGAGAGESLVLRSRTVRGPGVAWIASAVFRADEAGMVDLGRDPARSGSYQGISAMGLIWSQSPEQPSTDWAQRDVFGPDPLASLVTEISVPSVDDAD